MSNTNSNDIRVIQLNAYQTPKVEENKSKNWVLNGKNNCFFKYIDDRRKGSPTNSIILKSLDTLTYGNGLFYKNPEKNLANWTKLRSILKKNDVRNVVSDFNEYGIAYFQVIKTKNKKGIANIYHIPAPKIAPSIANEDEEIEGYWFCKDWNKQAQNPPEFYSAFGTSNDAIEIYCIKPYDSMQCYFPSPEYYSGLGYAIMEEEISEYYVSHIRNGLSFGYIINIPNGNSLSPEEKDELERKIKQKLTGSSNAGKFVLSFNGVDAEITVTPLQVNDAHKQWEYLTQEARQQLLTAHGIVSPMLFGIKDSTGLGNNADELDTAEAQLVKRVIQPKQRYILDALDEILNFYNINLDLYFVPLTEQTQSTNVSMSTHVCCADEKKKSDLDLFIELGEDPNVEGYELESVEVVDYEEDAIELATQTGTARPNAKSKWDTEYRIVRYRYAGNPNPEREFCKRMMQANKIYRREDIEAMGEKNVNPGFGMHPTPNKPYSIWKYKGGGLLSANFTGGTCKHYWEKLTYKRKDIKIDVKSPIAIDEAKKEAASGIAGQTPHSM